MRSVLFVAALAVSISSLAPGTSRGDDCAPYLSISHPGDSVIVYRLEDSTGADGSFAMTLEAGPVATEAVRVFSEPSHTLMLLAMDSGFRGSKEGQAWEQAVRDSDNPRAIVTPESLAGSSSTVGIAPRPKSDDRFQVDVLGCWPDGTVEERMIADAKVRASGFAFSSAVRMGSPAGDPQHCCEGGGCGQLCIDCQGPAFSCCLIPPHCNIACEHLPDPCG
jgi:hypothetical protein